MLMPVEISGLTQRAEELRELLTRWANQNSGSDHHAGLAAMHALLTEAFQIIGPVESVPLADTPTRALRVRFRPKAKWQVLFSGHYDTVYSPDHAFQSCTR